jgi:molybdate transport system substrate-binding protein
VRRLLILLAAAVAICGCGGDDSSDSDRPRLTVAAASSLQKALTEYAKSFPGADVKLSFAGSDAIAAQIREGVKPDVFVSADASIAQRLHDDGKAGAAKAVATNRLVLAIHGTKPKIRTFDDIAKPGMTLAMGTSSVPAGAYAEEALRRLPAAERKRIVANVRTREPDVAGVIGKVAAGAVDAGFVYVTDAMAAGDKVIALAIPERLQPRIEYAASVVRNSDAAQRFVDGLAGAKALTDAGFGAP